MESWFSGGLINWYQSNKRDLPWRAERDPYKIWLSEIILQQTQVAQGLSYYIRFTEHFPTVADLAGASEDQVLKLWQGLGYYSRARNLHAAAKTVLSDFGGNFPTDHAKIKGLKGIGDYTAAAIASFAFDQPFAVVDGNVYRVLSRVFGVELPIDSGTGKRYFQELANTLLNPKQAATNNQAIMEFGSQFCKPVNPDCPNCIFRTKCIAFQKSQVQSLPVKAKKTNVRDRFFNYLVICDRKKNILINRRSAGDIWQGLYEFVLLEDAAELSPQDLFRSKAFKKIVPDPFTLLYTSKKYKHVLSHQHLYAGFYVLQTISSFPKERGAVNVTQLQSFAFPRLIEKFMADCDLKEIL